MNKNLLPKKPCPFKPGLSITRECALFMGNACPISQECLNSSERSDISIHALCEESDESVSAQQNRENETENLLSFPTNK